MKPNVIVLFSALSFIFSGCMIEPGIDKSKFSELYDTLQDVKTAISSPNLCDAPDILAQKLSSGVEAVRGKTTSKPEQDLVAAYTHLLSIYHDGVLLCQSRAVLTGFPFVPRGRIYVRQELDPIVEKYGLSTERHLYRPTGQYWKSISADSIKVIWENAELEIQHIQNMTKYN